MRKHFARWPLGRRVVALMAAYAIALSSLIASFSAAQAVAEAATAPVGIICHTLDPQAPAPASDHSTDKRCAADCCVGAMPMMATLPSPVNVAGATLAISRTTFAPLTTAFVSGLHTKDHRSRAPPLAA